MHAAKIIGACILTAILYGVVHDQITARICVEYFTIGHPRLIDSNSPTVLGLFWGVVATWWVGLILGTGLAFAARAGSRPRLRAQHLVRPIGILVLCMAAVAVLAGMTGFLTTRAGLFFLVEPFASRVPPDNHVAFLTAGWAHSASYLAGFAGGIILCAQTWKRRKRVQGVTLKRETV